MNNGFLIFFCIEAVVILVFPILALFGFFEDRRANVYRFRSVRFMLVFVLSLTFILLSFAAFTYAADKIVRDSVTVTEDAVVRNRAILFHVQDNLSLVFPEVSDSRTCYAAAITNYVEDQWVKNYRAETCKLGADMCADDERHFFEIARFKNNPYNLPLLDLGSMDAMFKTVWAAAKDIYETTRSFSGILDPSIVGQPNVGTDTQAYDAYNQYILNCGMMKPLFWMIPDAPLINSPAGYCFGDCP